MHIGTILQSNDPTLLTDNLTSLREVGLGTTTDIHAR
jgi:hypothetical protein